MRRKKREQTSARRAPSPRAAVERCDASACANDKADGCVTTEEENEY